MYTIEDAIANLADDIETLDAQIIHMREQLAHDEISRAHIEGYKRVIGEAYRKRDDLIKTQTAFITLS